MNPNFWGPSTWKYLHSLSLAYPVNPTLKDKLEHRRFFKNLLLPCFSCEENYKKHFKELPIDDFLNTKLDLAYWVYLLHSTVNKKLGKKNISFKKVLDIYLPHSTCKILGNGTLKCNG